MSNDDDESRSHKPAVAATGIPADPMTVVPDPAVADPAVPEPAVKPETEKPTDDRDVFEIEVQLTDNTFDVDEKSVDQLDIKLHMPVRLKIGIVLVIFSFLMSGAAFAILLPWSLATSNSVLKWWFGAVYGGSWAVLGIGVIIGGRSAKDIVTGWTVKTMGHRFGSLKRRRKKPGN